MNRSAATALLAAVLAAAGAAGCISGRAAGPTPALPPSTPTPPPPPSAVRFRNVAAAAGLTYRWPSDGPRPRTILQTMGYGCAFLDYDGDGNLDILLVGRRLALFRGDGRGRFKDVTRAAGLDRFSGWFQGVAVGDYDNDGRPDLYVSGYRTGLLLHNEGGVAFRDVTKAAGLPPQPWGTSAGWADLDGDGFLDLVVCNYVDYDRTKPQLCREAKVLTACPPTRYAALHAAIFRNVGGRHFTDVTRALLTKPDSGNGLGVAFSDAAGEGGRPRIALANDLRPGDYYRPVANGRYEDIGQPSGTATDDTGLVHAGMGIDWGDADNDGKLDLFVTTYTKETKCLYRAVGPDLFAEEAHLAGIGTAAWNYVAFGCKFLDADNDGWLDLLIANGHTSDNARDYSPFPYREPVQFFHNAGRAARLTYTDETKTFAAAGTRPEIVGRGLAIGDYDNDGRMDALIVDGEGTPLLLHNETPNAGRYLSLTLVGMGRSPRDAFGARVTVTPEGGSGGTPRVRICQTAGSYLSASDARVHVGLGAATEASVMVRWPDGREQTWPGLSAGRHYRLTEGNAFEKLCVI